MRIARSSGHAPIAAGRGQQRRKPRATNLCLESLERRVVLSLTPIQVQDAYGINQIMYGGIAGNGAGQTIAIIDSGDDAALVDTGSANFDQSDLYKFDHLREVNLPDPPSFKVIGETGGARPSYIEIGSCTETGNTVTVTTTSPHHLSTGSSVTLSEVGNAAYDGKYTVESVLNATTFKCVSTARSPRTALPNSTGGTINNHVDTGETTLDVESAHAIAPAANIVLIELTNGLDDSEIAKGVKTAVSIGASVVSMSFSRSEFKAQTSGITTSYDDGLFKTAGVSFVASTGDNGANGRDFPSRGGRPTGAFPAYSPNVLAVGATNLYINANNSYRSETGWSNPPVIGGNHGGGGAASANTSLSLPISRAQSRKSSRARSIARFPMYPLSVAVSRRF